MIERSKHIVCLVLLLVVASCVDEINIPEETSDAFEPVLVVEATLTNELKNHQVILYHNPDQKSPKFWRHGSSFLF